MSDTNVPRTNEFAEGPATTDSAVVDDIMRDAPAPYASIDEAAHAYASGRLDAAGFVAVAVGLPVVRQNPMPDTPFWDDWPPVDGLMSDLQDALSQRLITAELYDAALIAMASAGHEA